MTGNEISLRGTYDANEISLTEQWLARDRFKEVYDGNEISIIEHKTEMRYA
jgi:hypothetical protein